MKLNGKKIGVLIESDYYEHEIWYYKYRFPEEGAELIFMSRLWGQPSLEFTGHEYKAPFRCETSFEDFDLDSLDALIVPSGMVADRLRYAQLPGSIPPASAFLEQAFNNARILKGIICHGLWLVSPIAGVIKGRQVTCHNNLVADAKNMGAVYVDQDLAVDGDDLITARTGDHCGVFAQAIIARL